MEYYNYVIARQSEYSNRLSVYRSEVHYGTKEDADEMTKIVSLMSGKEYKHYIISLSD